MNQSTNPFPDNDNNELDDYDFETSNHDKGFIHLVITHRPSGSGQEIFIPIKDLGEVIIMLNQYKPKMPF